MQRKNYIDVLRGLVMVIMLLDHVRDYFHNSEIDPLDASVTSPLLYFTRWITHFCAPIFVFLSGVSGWLQLNKYKQKGTARFFISRGLWLILMEWTVVALAWTFDPGFHFIPFQVIWAIGISMLIMGLLLYAGIKDRVMLLIGITIICAHNSMDGIENMAGFESNFWLDILHNGRFSSYYWAPNHRVVIVYPFLPWLGIMMLGFGMGRLFGHEQNEQSRRKLLFGLSALLLAIFVVLRASRLYGDTTAWSSYDSIQKTLMSFFNVRKYPPSLLYVCMTLGPAFFILALLENINNWLTRVFAVFGRTAFFFYVLHLYTIHTIAAVFYFARGHNVSELEELCGNSPFLFVVNADGFGLAGVYLVWISVVLLLYPLCKRYDSYKRAHPEKGWLRYL